MLRLLVALSLAARNPVAVGVDSTCPASQTGTAGLPVSATGWPFTKVACALKNPVLVWSPPGSMFSTTTSQSASSRNTPSHRALPPSVSPFRLEDSVFEPQVTVGWLAFGRFALHPAANSLKSLKRYRCPSHSGAEVGRKRATRTWFVV